MDHNQQVLADKIRNTAWKDYLNEKRWCAWFVGDRKPDGGGYAKIPRGSHSDPSTWSTFDEVCASLKPGDGFGYNFLGGDLHPLDLDHVRNPNTGLLCNEAMLLLSRLKSFSEISISGRGLHVLFRGQVRGHQLGETCVQYWHPAKAPRFFTVTGNVVGEAFNTVKDVSEDFNYIFATAAHISAKCREELRVIDPEQWAKLPAEPVRAKEETRDKSKTKSRRLHKDFNLEDFLKFYELGVDNVAKNQLGTCYRLTTCPIKGEPHVGQNSTTTNFILSTDGGLGFHCQSTGCVDYDVASVIKTLAEKKAYPQPIYEEAQSSVFTYGITTLADVQEEQLIYLWPGYLPIGKLVNFMGASSEGKSPVTNDLIARVTAGADWPDGATNTVGPRSVILMAAEDGLADTVKPRIRLAGGDPTKVKLFQVIKRINDLTTPIDVAIDRDIDGLKTIASTISDLAMIVIDPITNYLGKQGMNNEAEIRSHILMPLVKLAETFNTCVTYVMHMNKREQATVLQKGMGATAFTGVPRKVFLFAGDPEDPDKYSHVMSEVRDKQVALKYKTAKIQDSAGIQKDGIIQVSWLGVVERDTDEMVNPPKSREKKNTQETKSFLKVLLSDGEKTTQQIEAALKDAGIECTNWTRAAKRIPACNRKLKGTKTPSYQWYLPTEQASFDGAKE